MTKVAHAAMLVVFAVLYSWDLWEAIGNLVGLGPFYDAIGIGESIPWWLLWAGVALPVLVFGLAVVANRHRESLLERVVVFLVGWATVAAVSLSLGAIEQAWRASAVQALAL